MAASTWRISGLCRSMAGLLLLCMLLFSSGVMSEDDPAVVDQPDVPTTSNPMGAGTDGPAATGSPAADVTQVPSDSGNSVAPSDVPKISMTITNIRVKTLEEAPGTTAPAVADVKELTPVVPSVSCVEKKDIPEKSHVKVEVKNSDKCEETKKILQENPAKWCSSEHCHLNIFQEGNNVFVASNDSAPGTLAQALKSENLKKLGVSKVENPSSSSSVFVGILVSGLLAAVGIIVGYFKCQQRPGPKEPKLPEEGLPVDQENQGNTLVSVAPLNPPPETQEKPNINGESPEPAKTQTPPPTNGHSTAKTADTEL
nr:uncharacterized protein cd34 [Nothobranchius furzeri]